MLKETCHSHAWHGEEGGIRSRYDFHSEEAIPFVHTKPRLLIQLSSRKNRDNARTQAQCAGQGPCVQGEKSVCNSLTWDEPSLT